MKQYTIYLKKDDSIVASGTAEECQNVLSLDRDSEDVKKYFRGETLNADTLQ